MLKRTMVLVACTVGAAALSAEAASAARPRVQILNVGAVSNSAIPVKLRCTVPSGAACDVTVTVTSKSGKAATETVGERLVRLAPNVTRLVWVVTTSGGLVANSCAPAASAQAAGCAEMTTYRVKASGRADRKALPTVSRAMDGGPFIPTDLQRVETSRSSKVVNVIYVSNNGCPGAPGVRLMKQNKNEVVVDFNYPVDPANESACTQAFTPFCVSVTLDKPLGRRSVWAQAKPLVAPDELGNDRTLLGFPLPAKCRTASLAPALP